MADNNTIPLNVCDENKNEKLLIVNNAINSYETLPFDSGVCSETEYGSDSQNIISLDSVKNETNFFCNSPLQNDALEVVGNDFKLPSNLSNEHSSSCPFDLSTNNKSIKNIFDDENLNFSNTKISDQGDFFSDFEVCENANQFKDEVFHDAVQFFKDPSSVSFLENVGSSQKPIDSEMSRSSLYISFDPLHEKFAKQGIAKSNNLGNISETTTESNVEDSNISFKTTDEIVNKPSVDLSLRESIGNILISFDSPVVKSQTDNNNECNLEKQYSAEELQQQLKIQELSLQEIFLKRQKEIEEEMCKNQLAMEAQNDNLCKNVNILHEGLSDLLNISSKFSEKIKVLEDEKLELELENRKVKQDLKICTDDFQNLDRTFSDFHKRYEQCKNMLKTFKDNEDCLKQQVVNIQTELEEKEKMCNILQSKTEEMLKRASDELASAMKSSDAQVAVLKAQLKKAELKISSLESDYKQVKFENSNLGNICDELMAKVSNT